jgi:hypothetical protein
MEKDFMSKVLIKNCPYCGSPNIETSEMEAKCCDCGMGKYTDGKRK